MNYNYLQNKDVKGALCFSQIKKNNIQVYRSLIITQDIQGHNDREIITTNNDRFLFTLIMRALLYIRLFYWIHLYPPITR